MTNFVWKGVEPDMHPYGACYHDLANQCTTGIIEFLKVHEVDTMIVGGLATDYCVKATALDAIAAGYEVDLIVDLCRGVSPDTTESALEEMEAKGVTIIGG